MTAVIDGAGRVDGVDEQLRRVARAVRNVALDAIPDAEPSDWLYGPMRTYVTRPGVCFRAALCLAAGASLGASPVDLMGIAVAIELVHTGFLIHADLTDGGTERRGRPTLEAAHGFPLAINAGDAVASMAGQLLRRATRRLHRDVADQVWAEFDAMAMSALQDRTYSEAHTFTNPDEIHPEAYFNGLLPVCGWHSAAAPLRIGAIVGSAGAADLEPWTRLGLQIGSLARVARELSELNGGGRAEDDELIPGAGSGVLSLALVHLASGSELRDRTALEHYLQIYNAGQRSEAARQLQALVIQTQTIRFVKLYAQGMINAAESDAAILLAGARSRPDLPHLGTVPRYVWLRSVASQNQFAADHERGSKH